jgi:hypothetical protein
MMAWQFFQIRLKGSNNILLFGIESMLFNQEEKVNAIEQFFLGIQNPGVFIQFVAFFSYP